MRYSDEELSLIKSTFAENDDLIKAVRKAILQMPLNAVELSLIGLNFKDKEDMMRIMRKNFTPELDGNVPLGQEIDLFLTIGLKDMLPDIAAIHLKSIKIWHDYLVERMDELEGKKVAKPTKLKDLKNIDDKTDEQMYVDMLARNTIVNSTEQQLNQLYILAGAKDETPEETIKRLHKDSSK